MTKNRTVLAAGCAIHDGFLNFKSGTANTENTGCKIQVVSIEKSAPQSLKLTWLSIYLQY